MGNKIMSKMAVKYQSLEEKMKEKLKEDSGNWIDVALTILGSIVIGLVFIGAIVLLFKNNIIPNITKGIEDIFKIK